MITGTSKSPKKGAKDADEDELAQVNNNPWNYFDFDIPWSLNFTYNLNYNSELRGNTSKITNNRITVGGDLNITNEWKIAYQTGWDFNRKDSPLFHRVMENNGYSHSGQKVLYLEI
jgi:hypothetical protein